MDELAAAAKQDPVAYRRALLDKAPRAKAVLDLAAEKAGWGKTLAQRGRPRRLRPARLRDLYGPGCRGGGVEGRNGSCAARRSARSIAATVVNPDTVRAQIQSGIVFGLTAALRGEITLKGGRVEQSNFHDYQMLAEMNETPAIEVYIVASGEAPGGMGETGNLGGRSGADQRDLCRATGKRIRKLPVANQAAA